MLKVVNQQVNILEKELIDFANGLWKSYNDKLKELDIVVTGSPRIVVWESIREFDFTLWSNKKKDISVIAFPTEVQGKLFCTIDQAKEWVKKDVEGFIALMEK